MLRIFLKPALFIMPVFLFLSGYSQPAHFRFMFYNVENLFDIYDDPLTEDNDFLPGGVMRWNHSRYVKKINSLYKVMMAAGGWQPPCIIALCETENRRVLDDLLTETNMLKFDYGIIQEESPDERGIDVALLYRKDLVKVLFSEYVFPAANGNEIYRTRKILYVRSLMGEDTVHIFVNHWPSRRGGVLAGERTRTGIAVMIKHKVDSILGRNHQSKIIITGDFNCTPEDPVIKKITRSSDNSIINLAEELSAKGEGTYRFRGTWELIDQVIISASLMNCSSGLSADGSSYRIFRPDFLLVNDPNFPGLRPFSTYNGYRYQGGFSDHLPVLLDLFLR